MENNINYEQKSDSYYSSEISDDELLYDNMDTYEVQVNEKANSNQNQIEAQKDIRKQNQKQFVSQYQGKINLENIQAPHMTHSVKNTLKCQINRQVESKQRDKKDRATVEQVLDNRTRVILSKFIKNEVIDLINGCISTGKEANVYHSFAKGNQEYAIKIYKTSILVFKDRERYVEGEYRFRQGYCKSNPRKMVQVWAEKEFRNLSRIHKSVIKCPEPLCVKSNVLIMQFMGSNGEAAPRLKDAEVDNYEIVYKETLRYMRILFHDCKLIHADLSEYNLLYYQEQLYMIDVSQSIEHDHPHSLEFLKRDIYNINNYFSKMGVNTYPLRQVFDFIVDLQKSNVEDLLSEMDEKRCEYDQKQDNIFVGSFIPRNLDEIDIEQIEDEINKIFSKKDVYYDKLTGLIGEKNEINQKQQEQKGPTNDNDKEGSSESEREVDDDDESAGDQDTDKKKAGWSKHDGLSKKERKLAVKEEKREKRKDKIPKHIKKKFKQKN